MKTVIVGYLNTLPFIQGLEHFGIDMVRAHPAECAKILHEGEVDVGLIPVGALQNDQHYYWLKDYGITCNGEVRTVCLFGERPIEEWDKVILDYQSKTSVLLTEILLKEYWGISPEYLQGQEGYERQISKNTGGLIIGDRVFEYENEFPYKYDLGTVWKSLTGLPFVFAIWVALKPLNSEKKERLVKALEYGMKNFTIPDSMSKLPVNFSDYFKKHIEYHIGISKQKALHSFLLKTKKSDLKLQEL